MKPSRYNHIIRRRNLAQLLYNSWHHRFMELDNAQAGLYGGLSLPLTYNLMNQKDPPVAQLMAELTRQGFMIEDNIDEMKQIEVLSHLYRFDHGRLNLWICPTTRCDQGCPECPHQKNRTDLSAEHWEVVLRTIAARAPGLKELTITWWGGEPSKAWGQIKRFDTRLAELSQASGFKYGYRTIGNEAGEISTASLSQDNELWLNLAGRHNPGPTRPPVLLASLRQANEHSSGFLPGTRIRLIDNIPGNVCRNVNRLCQSAPNLEDDELESIQKLLENGVLVDNIPRSKLVACQAVDPQSFIVDVSGDIYRCWNDVGSRGKALPSADSDPLDPRNFRWLDWDPYHEAHCRLCNILPWCLGGCRAKPPDDDCSLWHYALREMLSLSAAANKNGA